MKQINEKDAATAYPNEINWLPPLGDSAYAFGAIYISWDPDPGTPYFDRSDGEACQCDLSHDGICDMEDYFLFGQDWGRTNCPVETVNIAPLAMASSSGGGDPYYGFGPENMNDGKGGSDCTMHWVETGTILDDWIALTWNTPVRVHKMAIDTKGCGVECGYNAGRNLGAGAIQWWNGSAWITDGAVANKEEEWSWTFSTPIETTALRVYGIATAPACEGQQSNPVIYEWYVYGEATGAADMLPPPMDKVKVERPSGLSPSGDL